MNHLRQLMYSVGVAGGLILSGCAEPTSWANHVKLVQAGNTDEIVFDGPVTDSDLASLSALSQLRVLQLSQANISQRGLEQLRTLNRLESLVLGKTTLDDGSWEILTKLARLKRLNLDRCRWTNEGLKGLADLPDLENLRFSSESVTDSGMAYLARLKQLRFLILRDVPISDAGLESLAELPRLESLYLSGTNVTEAAVSRLQQRHPQWHIHGP